jgi:hypothetical protein
MFAALTVPLPDYLNSGGDSNHDIGGLFIILVIFVLYSFEEGIYLAV